MSMICWRALAPIKHLQGSFSQQQYGQDNLLLAESSGKFRLLRPGYFSWEILSPDNAIDYRWAGVHLALRSRS